MLQIDAEDENGKRLDGFNFIHKAMPLSIGTDDWRLVRQVFRPAAPLKSIRLKLCARGMNGYTLDDTGHQPQQNAAGHRLVGRRAAVRAGEHRATELQARGVKRAEAEPPTAGPHLAKLDLGEQLLGRNVLTAEVVNPGPGGTFASAGAGRAHRGRRDRSRSRAAGQAGAGKTSRVASRTRSREPAGRTASIARTLSCSGRRGRARSIAGDARPVATWTVPIDLELGALYLRPEQKQFVRAQPRPVARRDGAGEGAAARSAAPRHRARC